MSIYCPTCSEGDCKEHSDEPHSYTVPEAAHTSPRDVTVTYYTTGIGDNSAPESVIHWLPATSSCGLDHATGTNFDTAPSDSLTVLRMVPESQVESLRETVSDLYRHLNDKNRRVTALEIALRDAVEALEYSRGFVSGYLPGRASESNLPRVDAPLAAARLLLKEDKE